MHRICSIVFAGFFLTYIPLSVLAQKADKISISGHVKEVDSGEALIGVNVWVKELKSGAVTNTYGFYSLTLTADQYTLVYSFIGYEDVIKVIDLQENKTLNVELTAKDLKLKEVVVEAEKKDKNVSSVGMSTVHLKMEAIKKMPVLLGEVDIIKAIQLLPGVQTVGEGTSGFFVRGGAVDQNLILLDESPVYNAAHLLGFFSVFNSDAIKDVQLYKGGIPAEYGGRLSSVLDIHMKEGNNKRFSVKGGIGTIASRLTIEAPLFKERASFMLSARRTYADMFLKLSSNEQVRNTILYFYDLNAKFNYRIGKKDRIFLSAYFGRDVFKYFQNDTQNSEINLNWGNATGTLRWNHVFNHRLFSNTILTYSDYDYSLGQTGDINAFTWYSNIKNLTAKINFTYYINPENTLKFGICSAYHRFLPGTASGTDEGGIFNEVTLPNNNALEHAVYLSHEWTVTPQLSILAGLRYSLFQNIGKGQVFTFDENYTVVDTLLYKKGEIFNQYAGLEPRLNIKYAFNNQQSVKLSYNRTRQYLQLASNTRLSSPLDIWFPASPNVKPQLADQIALGYFHNLQEDTYELSVEAYYKKMSNQIDFRDHATLLLNERLEGELRFGQAKSYGIEFLARKQKGRWTGLLSYTLSRTERAIPEINDGNPYPASYDKTHDIAITTAYQLNKRWAIAANWVYGTGAAVTMPVGRMEYWGVVTPVYSARNAERMPSYHRLDVSATLKARKKWWKRIDSEWIFSVYNAYARKNTFSIHFFQEYEFSKATYAEKLYLFSVVPSVTWNVGF